MPITSTPQLDCSRENTLGVTIRELTEHIAHIRTYSEMEDTEPLERQLQSLKDQMKRQSIL